ncbi:hypothetical protein [Candidatus Magnetobacterium casense]|uniref:Uncharacterized protein n=1 Tax=Candidatus Magnetobacterium casense TaxID=1455061 RepID=A0ABS6RWJ7_9BACT|nr:hypothetical protein [Candidatus Magnetobacterium casensis]MBV6340404.1 hypothetical protein [Candidatus Magnetobacterium casensis]
MTAAFISLGADTTGSATPGSILVVDIFRRKASVYTHQQTITLQREGDCPKELKERFNDRTLTTYLCLRADSLNYRIIEMPFSEKDKILETLPYAIEGLIRGSYDACVADCIVLGQQGSGQRFQVLVVYIDKAILQGCLSELKALGLEPKVVTSLELRYKINKFSVDSLYDDIGLSEGVRLDMCQEELNLPLMNLARGELAYTKDVVRTQRGVRIVLFLMAVLIVLVASHTGYKIYLVNKRVETLKSYMQTSYKRAFVDDARVVDPLYQLKAKVKEAKAERAFFESISPLQNLSVLSSVGFSGVVLTEVDMSSQGMVLKGEALRISEVDQYKGKLAVKFSQVSVMQTKTATDNIEPGVAAPKVVFSIHVGTSEDLHTEGQGQ